jgi:CheY-like chemotaxis protein
LDGAFYQDEAMNTMNIQDAWLPLLLATAFGLGIGAGLSTLIKTVWRGGADAISKLQALAPQRAARPSPRQDPELARAAARTLTPAQLTTRVLDQAQLKPSASPPLPTAADLLLVDDSAVARAKLRKLFEAPGYSMHFANDGVEALALLKQGRYALMITDLEMPNMDGVALINASLANPQTARMPILAITGHDHLRAKFNECKDICGIHRKPWVDDILLSHVAAIVDKRRAHYPHVRQVQGGKATTLV